MGAVNFLFEVCIVRSDDGQEKKPTRAQRAAKVLVYLLKNKYLHSPYS